MLFVEVWREGARVDAEEREKLRDEFLRIGNALASERSGSPSSLGLRIHFDGLSFVPRENCRV
mgnify:CR=1 FL=1